MFSSIRFPVKDTDFSNYIIALILYILIAANKLRLGIASADEMRKVGKKDDNIDEELGF